MSDPRRECALRGHSGRLLLLFFFALALIGGRFVCALEPSTPLANYARQSWVMENGLPQNTIHAIAQTPDGFVWLGTEAGLVRFDGVAFQVFDHGSTSSASGPSLPGNDIRCLLVMHDGALWIGTGDGLVRWTHAQSSVFTTANGLPADGIRALKESPGGELRVSTDQGTAKLSGARFEADGSGEFNGAMAATWADSNGALHATASAGTLEIVRPPQEGARSQQPIARLTAGRELPGTRIQSLLADREGSLWIGTNGGLARWADGKLQPLPVTDPLATASVLAVMEDREGNLWVGTETGGLHILRDQRFPHDWRARGAVLRTPRPPWWRTRRARSGWERAAAGLNALQRRARKDGVKNLHRERWAAERRDSVAGRGAERRSLGGHAGWTEPDSRRAAVDAFTSADGLPDDFIRSLLADADGRCGLARGAG